MSTARAGREIMRVLIIGAGIVIASAELEKIVSDYARASCQSAAHLSPAG
jgi:hypothetical protein